MNLYGLISFESVNTALRDCAGLLFKEFALVVLDENGEEKVFTSAALTLSAANIYRSIPGRLPFQCSKCPHKRFVS